jgi:hypothetical protein
MAGLLSYQLTPQANTGQFLGDALSSLGAGLLAYGQGGNARNNAGLIGLQALQDASSKRQDQAYRALQTQSLTQQMALQQQAAERQQQLIDQANQQREAYKGLLGGQPIQGPTQSGAPLNMKSPVNPMLANLPAGVQATLPLMDPEQGTSLIAQLATQKPQAPTTVGGMQYDPAQKKFVPIPGYTEQAQAIAAAGRAPQQLPSDIQEYQYAKSQGYNGSYVDYVKMRGQANQPTFSPVIDTNGNIVGQKDNSSGKVEPYPQGPSKAPTEVQAKSGGFFERMQNSEKIIQNLGNTGTSRTQDMLDQVPIIGNSLISGDKQQLDQAERDFINAQLRQESGAAISPSEFDNARKQYFPQPGDTLQTIQQKQQNRAIAIQAMNKNAGVAYFNQGTGSSPKATSSQATAGAPVSGAKKAPDGNWYIPDPNRPGKYLQVVQ